MNESLATPQPLGTTLASELSPTEEVITWLSDILQDQTKRKALFELRGHHAQSLIDGLNYFVLDEEFRKAAEAWLVKHTVIALRKLCEVSSLYPTCYVLGGIEGVSAKSGGGFCDISQGRYRGQLICLKIVRLYQDSNIKQLLKAHAREAILWGQLDHPNIVPFYGIFYLERKERICLVSPWMEDGDIVEYLQRVSDAPRRPFIDDIASGLHYLHAENVVHGDLKGRNVLINKHGKACIADFGLSTIVTNETLGFAKTTVGSSGWTMRWASPELLNEHARPNHASDVWAFGCVCYEVLTGIEPFAGCSDIAVLGKLFKRELPARLDDAGFDDTLRNLIGRCWSVELEQRPGCLDILRDLGLEGCESQQRRDAPSNRLRAPVSTIRVNQSWRILKQLYRGNEMDNVDYTEGPSRTLVHEDAPTDIYDFPAEGVDLPESPPLPLVPPGPTRPIHMFTRPSSSTSESSTITQSSESPRRRSSRRTSRSSILNRRRSSRRTSLLSRSRSVSPSPTTRSSASVIEITSDLRRPGIRGSTVRTGRSVPSTSAPRRPGFFRRLWRRIRGKN